MTSKPEYIDLLNDIRLQEHRAGVYLEAWANKTENKDLKECLSFVAAREYSHGDIFDRRVKELGFDTQEIEDPDFEKKTYRTLRRLPGLKKRACACPPPASASVMRRPRSTSRSTL